MAFYIGVEKVINGSFDYDTNWEKNTGWTIGSGVATADGSTHASHLYQNIQLNDLKTYAYSFDYVASIADGKLKMQWNGNAQYYDIVTLDAEFGETGGHVEGEFTVGTNTNNYIYFQMVQGNAACWAGTIDNVQVRELKLVMDNEKTSYFVNVAPSFKFRTIISYQYMVGGYHNSTCWRTAHKVVASTDQGANLGDMLQKGAGYTDGVGNNKQLFVFGTDGDGSTYQDGYPGNTTYTSSFSMINDTTYTHSSTHNTAVTRNQGGTVWLEEYFAWIFGGHSNNSDFDVEKMDLTNEAMTATVYNSLLSGDNDEQAACGKMVDEHFAYIWDNLNAVLFNMVTESESTSTQWGPYGQQRGISSKNRRGWCGSEGSYSSGPNWNRWDLTTNTNLGTMTKINNSGTGPGEENYTMGQDHQYMLGNHDGNQNNESHKFFYATETGVVNPTGLAPTAHTGQSSATCGWRS